MNDLFDDFEDLQEYEAAMEQQHMLDEQQQQYEQQPPAPPRDQDLVQFDTATANVDAMLVVLAKYATINSVDTSNEALEKMKQASAIEKMIEEKRKELVKPYNEKVSKINTYAKGLTAKIAGAVQTGKNAVLAFNKLEAERVKKELISARRVQLEALGMMLADDDVFKYESVQFPLSFIDLADDKKWGDVLKELASQIQRVKDAKKAELEKGDDLLEAFGSDEDKKEHKAILEELNKPGVVGLDFNNGTSKTVQTVYKAKGTTQRWVFKVTDAAKVPREFLMVDESKIRAAVAKGERNIGGVEITQDVSLSLR